MSTILGIISGVGLLFGAIFFSGGIASFIDAPSAAIVFGGTLGALFTAYPLPTVLKVSRVLVQIFKQDIQTPTWVIAMMVRLAFKARQKSLLSLEEDMRSMDNRFIKQGLEMIIDGHPGDLIRDVLQTELDLVRTRHNAGANIFISASKYAPAFGMIGTLIGLVAMLKNMGASATEGSNPMAGVGEGMAVALITTFYGSMMANLFFSPVAEKLKNRSEDEVLSTTIIIEGLLMIQSGINPRLVEKKLNSFLPPHLRAAHYDRVVQQSKGGGGKAAGGGGGGGGGGRAAPPPRQAPKIQDADDFDDDF